MSLITEIVTLSDLKFVSLTGRFFQYFSRFIKSSVEIIMYPILLMIKFVSLDGVYH